MSKFSDFFSSREGQPSTVDSALWVRSCTTEITTPVEGKLSGKIPEWVSGSLVMNGPGTYVVGDHKLKHLFDGMALLQKFNISNGKISYQNKFVKSDAYVKGRENNRVIFGEFGTAPSVDHSKSFFKKLASFASKLDIATDNTFISVHPISGSFYAMTETPRIQKINIDTLETIERIDLEDKFEIITYTAHPQRMRDGTLYNLGYSITSSGANYNIVHFSNGDNIFEDIKVVAKAPARFKLHPSYSHSFGVTENFFVIVETPLTMSVTSLIRSAMVSMAFTESLKWLDDENTRIILINRSTGVLEHVFYAEPFYFLYIVNQFEKDDHVLIDLCCYRNSQIIDYTFVDQLMKNDASIADKFQSPVLRFAMPLNASEKHVNLVKLENSQATATLSDGKVFCHPELLSDIASIFPGINYSKYSGIEYQFFYSVGMDVNENYGALIKVDVKDRTNLIWKDENVFAWEPKFIPSPDSIDEDDGIILAGLSYSGIDNKAGIVILDAKNMEEIARCEFCDLVTAIPKPLHGFFVSEK